MINDFKRGDKFLLPGSLIADDWLSIPCKGGSIQFRYDTLEANRIAIPASTLTDLQAENARLKTALASIRDILSSPDSVEVEAYWIAVETLEESE